MIKDHPHILPVASADLGCDEVQASLKHSHTH